MGELLLVLLAGLALLSVGAVLGIIGYGLCTARRLADAEAAAEARGYAWGKAMYRAIKEHRHV